MARPKTDDSALFRGHVAPPPMDAAMLRLWHREFDRFPPGYFVPADVSAMTLYLHTLAEYEAARERAKRARKADAQRDERRELRAIARVLILQMRALRMFPSARLHPTTAGKLAHDPTQQVAPASDEPAWRRMMREAGNLKPN